MGLLERIKDKKEWTHEASIRKSVIALVGACSIYATLNTAASEAEHYERMFTNAPKIEHIVQSGDGLRAFARCEGFGNDAARDFYEPFVKNESRNARYFRNGGVMTPHIGLDGKMYAGTSVWLPDINNDGFVGYDSTRSRCR